MKIYKKYKLEEPNRRRSVKREIKLMERMRNHNIVQLYEIIDTTKYVILIMEYVGGGSIHGYLKSKSAKKLEEWDAKRLFKQILEGLKYCHTRCITHRDIKLENLLLDDQSRIKIIDFGFSTCIPNEKKIKIFCGTPSYMAPEIVLKTEYCGPPADIWALGVLLFTILTG
jgi:serine/threonine protein kinase